MVDESERAASEVAEIPGIGLDLICRWRREMRRQDHIAFPDQDKQPLPEEQRKIKELENELRDAELDRDIFLLNILGIHETWYAVIR